jgi:hypothetical protein
VKALHPLKFLLDDGAGIQFRGHAVAGGADHLHSPLVSLLIGISTNEGRQEAVMDVDDAPRIVGAEIFGSEIKDTHICRQANMGIQFPWGSFNLSSIGHMSEWHELKVPNRQ